MRLPFLSRAFSSADPARSERLLARALSIADLRRMARRRLPRAVFEFIDGGAGDEITLKDNRAAFERRRIIPRVLVDVSAPAMRTEIAGASAAAPLLVAPMGSCALAWPDADLAIARAATSLGLPYTLSTMATRSLERMAREVEGRLWFQLYVLSDRSATDTLVDRANAAGYEALVVTVDLPAGGKRERDLRNGISLPMRINARHLLEGAMRPGWALRTVRAGMPEFENVRGLLGDTSAGLTIAARVGRNLDAAFGWNELARLRERWPRQLLVKGVEHPADAERLIALGADGIWVSNHGGRQLDGAIATADALELVADATRGRIPLIVDSGICRGVDLLKAVALGAQAGAVGRAALFGAAVAGEAGVRHALTLLLDELALAMKLSGIAALSEANRSILAPLRADGRG